MTLHRVRQIWSHGRVCATNQQYAHWNRGGRFFALPWHLSPVCSLIEVWAWSFPGESWPWSLRHGILFILYTAPYWEGREQLHVAVVVCNDRAPEALTMMKSAVMFSTSPLVVHIFTQDDLRPVMSSEVRRRSLGCTANINILGSLDTSGQDHCVPSCYYFIVTLIRLFPGVYLGLSSELHTEKLSVYPGELPAGCSP